MIQLFDFPDEILCQLFEYLSSFDALYSFMNLNDRFNRLLTPFKYQIDFTFLSYEQFNYYINRLLPILNKHDSLKMIKLGNRRTPGQIQLFNTIVSNASTRHYYNQVECLVLQAPNLEELIQFIDQYVLLLPNLVSLSIEIGYIPDNQYPKLYDFLTKSIFALRNLIKLSIEIPSGLSLSRLSNPILFHSLIYIKVNLQVPTDLLVLIQCIENVENLFIYLNWWSSRDSKLVAMLNQLRSNQIQTTVLKKLKKFSLTINSIIIFEYEHFKQMLTRILHDQTTSSLSFSIINSFQPKDEFRNLIDGKQWENILSFYPMLNEYNVFFQLISYSENIDDVFNIQSFQSNYFQKKNWFFSFSRMMSPRNAIFHSIPCKFKQPLDIPIYDNIISNMNPATHTPVLSLTPKNDDNVHFNQQLIDFISQYFPCIGKLILNDFIVNNSKLQPLHIPTLHTVQIPTALSIDLFDLLHLFPFINTLFISSGTIDDASEASESSKYNRISELHLTQIFETNYNQVLKFLNQFPNIRFLHLSINGRRASSEILLTTVNRIIEKLPFLIYLELRLEQDMKCSINLNDELNNRIKMRSTSETSCHSITYFWL